MSSPINQGAPLGRTGSGARAWGAEDAQRLEPHAQRPAGRAGEQTSGGNLHIMQIMRRSGQHAFCAAHNSSIMLNCRLPNLAGQAAPDGEQSHRQWWAGKTSAVRGRGKLGASRACPCHRASGNEGEPSPTKPPSRLRSIRRRSGLARRSPPGAASPWPRLLGRRAQWRSAGGN